MTAPSLGALARNPTTIDMVQPGGYLAQIKKLPNVTYFMQEVEIPDIKLPPAIQSTPFTDIPWVGNNVYFGDLNIDFKISEDFANYNELYNWITTVGFARNTKDYGDLTRLPKFSGLGVYSDISIIPTDNLKNPNYEFVFEDCWPTALGKFKLQTNTKDVPTLNCTASFKYTIFTIKSLVKPT